MTQGEIIEGITTVTTTIATTTPTNATPAQNRVPKDSSPSMADSIAAVTIAVLACVLVIILTLIVRAIRLRRRRERGRELDIIPTVSAGIVNANVSAYGSNHAQRSPRPTQSAISWEPIMPSTSTSDIMASAVAGTSGSTPSSC